MHSLLSAGPVCLIVGFLCVLFPTWLLVIRIVACFRPLPPNPARDIALLLAAPVCAILLTLIQGAVGTMVLLRGGIDADYALSYGLHGPVIVCGIALTGFVVNVIALMLPERK